jgi:hypothetical protein
MTVTSEQAERVNRLAEVLYRIINHQRDYAVQLWEFGKLLAEIEKRGLPPVLGEEAILAKRMKCRNFNSAEEVRKSMPVPMPLIGGNPPKNYFVQLEDWLGVKAVQKMRKAMDIIKEEAECILQNVKCHNLDKLGGL